MKAITLLGAIMAVMLLVETELTSNNKIMNVLEKEPETIVMEIALFNIKESAAESFMDLNKKTLPALSELDGYIKSSTYQNLVNPLLYLDIVEWESLSSAQQSAELFEKDERFKAYLESIEELKYFDHVSILPVENNGLLKYREATDKDILELASFFLKEETYDEFAADRIKLMDHMGRNYDGFKQVATVRSHKDPLKLIDLGGWESEVVCQTAQKDLENDSLFHAFMSHLDMEKEMMMEFFTKIR